jgi:hypothetical protein
MEGKALQKIAFFTLTALLISNALLRMTKSKARRWKELQTIMQS